MKTSKPFSTISYNTAGYLVNVLNDLIQKRKIVFYAFIEHYPEEDEKKKHKHLWIVPNGKIDTDSFRDALEELDLEQPLLPPLGCMPCKSSKFQDWYLYSCHDVTYLASKGQTRKYHYSRDDFTVSDEDYFTEEIHTIDHTQYNRFGALLKGIEDGKSFADLLVSGVVPLQQTYAWEKAYNILKGHKGSTFRNGNTAHEVDNKTGEMLNSESPNESNNLARARYSGIQTYFLQECDPEEFNPDKEFSPKNIP